MRHSKKMTLFSALLVSAALFVTACGGGSGSDSGKEPSASGKTAPTASNAGPSAEPAEKIKLTLMIASADDPVAKSTEQRVAEHFADKYEITFKQWDLNAEKTIKTSIASGEPIDLAMYWPNRIDSFQNANMALDLTPYLEENNGEWKDVFLEGSLGAGTLNGKVYAVPYAAVYPMLEVNQDILDQAGVTLPADDLTWDEFMKALETIKAKTGITPFGLYKDWSGWVPLNNLITVWPDDAKRTEFAEGKISFQDPLAIQAFDASKELYDNELVYPGKGALSATLEQVNIAFKTGKIAIKANVNHLAAASVKESGLKNVRIVSWPHMGTLNYVLGGSNGYMIPANVEHPEASVEVLKYLTSAEVLQQQVDAGQPVTIKGVKSEDPNFALYAKDVAKIQSKDIAALSSKMTEVFQTKMPANYIFNGRSSLEELEKIRLEAIQEKK